ncbi:MAG: CoA-binding protein [Bdellovibrio sp. CG12_big_fil_rev_8_21_14_0_65_39_13]|nr:MAG: CoA-binding protein [Bdellovibrio sp. CG22_combo_CG10-13_8_21_14_all_39_27]PIQ61046.1 MAG: CoA-binding protein [Bdellovibrio sp. CG12_big_fil_rev_8_21_14_0_65_39_13]PIR36813.1 MAG: CoA-binding protein [Bdellovibrio sp. CG11_big_fil_rev_8_21_14_0_20_39_38]
MKERVAILGASDNPERYSYKAMEMLEENGHEAILVSPRYQEIEGKPVHADLTSLKGIDTLTLYVNAEISSKMKDQILNLKPKRVIFNPGTENPSLEKLLTDSGIAFEEACTLVLLRTNQF